MAFYFHINYQGAADLAIDAGVSKRVRTAAMQYAYYQTGRFWHRFILPKHFTPTARQKYKYQRRKRRYEEIKRQMALGIPYVDPRTGQQELYNVKKGGRADVVHEGYTEAMARVNRHITSTTVGFTVKVRVPRYVTMRRRRNYPDMRKEIGRITLEEGRILTKVWWHSYRKFLDANRVTIGKRL